MERIVLTLLDEIPFGKYKGIPIFQIVDKEGKEGRYFLELFNKKSTKYCLSDFVLNYIKCGEKVGLFPSEAKELPIPISISC